MPIEDYVPASSMIDDAQYDSDQGVMTVRMKSGRTYDTEITPEQWAEFKQAGSPGSWYRRNIMGLT